jgi:hypothetical protein
MAMRHLLVEGRAPWGRSLNSCRSTVETHTTQQRGPSLQGAMHVDGRPTVSWLFPSGHRELGPRDVLLVTTARCKRPTG